ncbi:homoserine O-acetyltransferase MetA [Sphingobacterium spiritivorum]|uniref:Homoserine O-acetyltransferase n=1 Tax=Sphingobacterium spiritivorum ATCC 33861 TaxID=525373 RepID=D7VQZ6_SPHSI|nr:homoserine O-succinyltransferase [Sphingobacterium spiritivorum]EFK56197.1 homoserine O-succinyltransferase [Sphingobacterium spiritivorum ATCC 33861]QQT35698.1 homoserine O-succinyltransferase [Sphingobacterium spiritivorum]WQD32410.1 homoserine O-succinyltransferase [Sphingobacterium spiritivorum]SUJ09212.1 Homoserine O-succinyltransferase [Sphingobacterium spiritivorum]
MPVKIPNNLPAIELLKKENIFVMSDLRANTQDIRPMRVLILNLMPLKISTETDFVRLLSNNPLQVEVEFLRLDSHTSKNTPEEHLELFYKGFGEIKENFYDGMIITGAPVEMMKFEDVNYWEEVTMIFDWARKHVTSSLYICWASQAALYHFYGVEKVPLAEKLFGVFKHTATEKTHPLFRGFDDEFFIPHSRHTTILKADLEGKEEVSILSESTGAGIAIASSRGGREFYLTGHSEYAPLTLHEEYVRDVEKGLPIEVPLNYYTDNNPANPPLVRWTSHANLLFNNWLNYFVYQETPYDLKDVEHLGDIKVNS